jgi:RNA polymerase sigma-70 factor (ECF subfamily)
MSSPLTPEDESLRQACAAGDVRGVTTSALRRYGPELLGFLVASLGDYDAAGDAFATFSERLWQTLAQFDWRCSLRTWCYRLARNAAIDLRRREARRKQVGLSDAPEVQELAVRLRTETLSLLRTAKRGALEQLRDELPEEDRTLLVLRLDRQLEWTEIALVLDEGAELPSDEVSLKREAARLRKRFQLVKERVRAMGRQRGIIG